MNQSNRLKDALSIVQMLEQLTKSYQTNPDSSEVVPWPAVKFNLQFLKSILNDCIDSQEEVVTPKRYVSNSLADRVQPVPYPPESNGQSSYPQPQKRTSTHYQKSRVRELSSDIVSGEEGQLP